MENKAEEAAEERTVERLIANPVTTKMFNTVEKITKMTRLKINTSHACSHVIMFPT